MTAEASLPVESTMDTPAPVPGKVVELAPPPARREGLQPANHVESIVSAASFRELEPGSRAWEEALVEALAEQFSPAEMSALQCLAVLRQGFSNDALFFICRRAGGLDQKAALALRAKLTSMQLMRAAMSQDGHSEYRIHTTVARAVANIMDEKSRRQVHEHAAAWHEKPYADLMEEALPAIIEQAARYWRDKKFASFDGATEDEWRDSGGQLPERHIAHLRRACQLEYLTAAVTRGEKASIVRHVENALALHHHLVSAGRAEEAARIEALILEPLERWGRLEEACVILKSRAAGQSGAERIATLERLIGHLQKLQRWDEALPPAREIHNHYARLQDKPLEIKALQRLRDLWRQKGAHDEALETQKKILALEAKRDNPEGLMLAHHDISALYMGRGRTGNVKQSILSRFQIYLTFVHGNSDFAQAIIHSRKAERLARRLSDTQARARALHQRGVIMDYFGQTGAAEKYYLKALDLRRQIADEEGVADSLQEIGKTYLATAHALLVQGKVGPAHVFFNKAQRCFFDSIEIFRAINKQDKVKIVQELMESTIQSLSR